MKKLLLPERTNITLSISGKAKVKLARLKLRLREHGFAPAVASESAIVDRLVLRASVDDVLALFA